MMEMMSRRQANSMRLKSPLVLALCFVFFVQSCFGAAEPRKAFLDAQTLYDGWQANYGNIKSMKFRLSEARGFLDEGGVSTYSTWHHWEKIEDGKRVYVRSSNREIGFADANTAVIYAFDGRVGKQYFPGQKQGAVYLGLRGALPEIRNPMRQCLDGGTMHISNIMDGTEEGMRKLVEDLMDEFPEGIPLFTFNFVVSQKAGRIRVLPGLESVAGPFCHVIEMGDPESGYYRKFWLAHEKGMLLMPYVNQEGPERYNRMEVAEIASVKTDVGQVWYPSLVIREGNGTGRDRRHEIRVHEFMPHIKVPPETFDIGFPIGTRVLDTLAKVSYTVGADEDILAPERDDDTIAQEGRAAERTTGVEQDREPQVQETPYEAQPSDADGAFVRGKVSGEAGNGGRPVLGLVVGGVIAVTLGFCFCIRRRRLAGKEVAS
jgi:hypothetical protein